MRWQAKLRGEDVHCADREQSQRDFASGEAIDHLISRSIAASSNDFFESLLDSLTGEHLCFAGTRCSADGAAAGDRFDTFLPVLRLFVTCSWVENDDCVLHTTR